MAKINGITVAKERLNVLEYIAKKELKGNALLRALMKWSMDSARIVYENFKEDEKELGVAADTIKIITGINIMGTIQEQTDVEGLAENLNNINFDAVKCTGAYMVASDKTLARERHRIAYRTDINGKAVGRTCSSSKRR